MEPSPTSLKGIVFFWRALWWRSMVVVAMKERISLSRNKIFWRGVVVLQALQLVLMGFLDTQTRDLPVVVVDQDHSTYSRELIAKVRATAILDVKYITHRTAVGRDLVRAGHAKACIVIPPDYHERRAAKTSASVLMLVDGSDAPASAQAVAAFKGLAAELSVDDLRAAGKATGGGLAVDAHTLILYNPDGSAPNYMLPALLVALLGGLMMMGVMGVVRERDSGTLERLLMTPLSITGLMLGKAAPVVVVGMVDAAVVLALMRWVFGVPIQGSLLLIFVSLFLYLLTIAGLGVYLGSTSQTSMDASSKAGYIMIPNTFLSGYIFPLAGVPKVLLPLAYALPATHMTEIMRGSVLRDAQTLDMLPHILYLALVPVFLIWMASRKFRETIGAS